MALAVKRKKQRKNWLYALAQLLLGPFYRLVYRIRAEGVENVPADGSVLICCNHVAIKDPFLLAVLQRRQIFFMGKEELFRNRLLGGLLRFVGAFPVARGTGGAEALTQAEKLLNGGSAVGVFIEGTRSKTGELQKPKTGAAMLAYRTRTPIVPACITGEGGKRPAPFRKSIVKFGKPLTAEELNLVEGSGMELRRASRTVMGAIAAMREQALGELGTSSVQPSEKGE